MRGKLIIIEGTDCSGKEKQAKALVKKLNESGHKAIYLSFPMYDTPTGKIIGATLLGKPKMCQELLKTDHSFFPEGGGNIDSLTASCLYAADRRYNLPVLTKYLNSGYIVVCDRYTISNMAHRAGLAKTKAERLKLYTKLYTLEYDILELPRPTQVIFLYMPYEYACILKSKRAELPDETENNEEYLKRGEQAYLELAKLYHFDQINCVVDNQIRSIASISEELYNLVLSKF